MARDLKKKLPQAYTFPHLLMISASAGTGKTHALASRYIEFILAPESRVPHNDISNILAITFTNKAAREMKERILESLKGIALGTNQPLIEQMREKVVMKKEELQDLAAINIDRIIDRYSDFQIQTIDSFSNRVANSAALELMIPPDFETTMTHTELLRYALSLMLKGVGPTRDSSLKEDIDEFIELINAAGGGSFEWNPELAMRRRFDQFLGLESREVGSLRFGSHNQTIRSCMERILRTYREIEMLGLERKDDQRLEAALRNGDLKTVTSRKFNSRTFPVSRSNVEKSKMHLYEEAKAEWCELEPVVERLALLYASSYYHAYGEVYRIFKERMESAKVATGTLHISDISKKLNRYLEEEVVPDVYLRLGDRLYHFLIDEFQDTNPIQWKNLKPLTDESLSKNGSLFLVGDLKQAIYMFRSADYRIMRELYLEITGKETAGSMLPPSVGDSSHSEELACNHRSGEVIVQYVEELFKKNLKSMLGSEHFRYDLTGLTTFPEQGTTPENKSKGYVKTMRFFKTEDDPEPGRAAMLQIIKDATGRGYCLADIAILAAKNAELVTMVDWLTQDGVAASASSSLDIRNRRVVAELIELLRFLDSPVDDLAFARFISGEIFAKASADCNVEFTRGELEGLLLKTRSGENAAGYLYQTLRRDPKFNVLWEEYLEPLYRKTGYCPLYDLVSQALGTFRVFDHFPDESGSLVKLLEAVSGLESKGKNSVKDFIELAADEQSEPFSLQLPDYTDSVRLMTFHKSKGLGFPIVINMLAESDTGRDSMCYDRVGEEIRTYYITKDLSEKSAELGAIRARKETDDQIQQLNVLYVICTRAREELYNVVVLDRDDGLFGRLFHECELGKRSHRDKQETFSPAPTSVELQPGEVPVEKLGERETWCYSRWMDAEKGEVYHRVLQNIEFLGDAPDSEIADSVRRTLAQSRTPFDTIEIETKTKRFISLAEVKDWFTRIRGRQVFREHDFVDREGNVHRMDRVLILDKGAIVIDFKAGEKKDYSGQLKTYANVLREIYPGRRVRAYLAYVDIGLVEEVG